MRQNKKQKHNTQLQVKYTPMLDKMKMWIKEGRPYDLSEF